MIKIISPLMTNAPQAENKWQFNKSSYLNWMKEDSNFDIWYARFCFKGDWTQTDYLSAKIINKHFISYNLGLVVWFWILAAHVRFWINSFRKLVNDRTPCKNKVTYFYSQMHSFKELNWDEINIIFTIWFLIYG